MVAWLTPSGSGAGMRTDGTCVVGTAHDCFQGRPTAFQPVRAAMACRRRGRPRTRRARCRTARSPPRSRPRPHRWSGCRSDTGTPPAAHRASRPRRPGRRRSRRCGSRRCGSTRCRRRRAPRPADVGHADEAPLGVGATVDEHGLGVVAQQLPRLFRRDVSRVAHDRECPIPNWDRSNRPSTPRPRGRTSRRTGVLSSGVLSKW